MYLPDINVWLALAFAAHQHHSQAAAWFRGLPEKSICFFCRQTQHGFLRIASNARAFGADTLSLSEAWDAFDRFLSDPKISYAVEPAGLDVIWRRHTQGTLFSTNVWSDAYLAAFAESAGLTLVTFDRAFLRWTTLSCVTLC